MQNYDNLYIDGRWIGSTSTDFVHVINASTEQVMGRIPAGTTEDVDAAVAAARSALGDWSATPVEQRALLLTRLHKELLARGDEIARTITGEVGMPLKLSRIIQAGLPAAIMKSYAELVTSFSFEEKIENSLILHEAVGVVGCITPWNYPLHQIVAKVAPALGAGCTIVLKPSEVAPLNAFILAEIMDEVGVPPGVFNLVSGLGSVVGEAMTAHPGIDMISFTGSTRAGQQVSASAANTVKPVSLELGGKSAAIILDDADLSAAVNSTVKSCFLNSGQTCNALTRILVPESLYQRAAELAVDVAQTFTMGDPFGELAKLGPLISEGQRERVRSYIRKGMEGGAELLLGGPEVPEGLEKGYFVKPTLFGRVDPKAEIAQDEIFGPVLCILTYQNEDDALRIANDTIYGLAGAVWSGDEKRARRIAKRMRAGQVDINGGRFNPFAPFGGCKQSGHGRELGRFGLEGFLVTKSLQF